MKTQKTYSPPHPLKIFNALVLHFLLYLISITLAQTQSIDFCGVFAPHQANSTNPDSIVFDRFGNSYDIGHFQTFAGSERNGNICGHFNLYFDGIADSIKGTICEVFEDISDLIEPRVNEAPCGEILAPENVLIYIAYKEDITFPVLASGSPLYTIEGQQNCDEIQLNRANSKINGSKLLPFIEDGALFINPHDTFAHALDTLKWHTDTNSSPDSSEFDLYSIILHEVLHILAFESRIKPNGEAVSNYFSLWDNFIYTTSEYDPVGSHNDLHKLLVSDCEVNCWSLNDTVFNTSNEFTTAVLTNCTLDGDIDFVFGQGIAPLTRGDSTLQALSHLADSCNTHYVNYIMQPGIKRGIESERRNITDAEKEILCLLGYKLDDCDECFIVASKEEVQSTPSDYHKSCCNPIFNGCVGDTLVINYADLLCNDFTNGSELQISDWNTETSGITISPNDTSFLVYANIQAAFVITYTIKGCDCRLVQSTFTVNFMPCVDCSAIDPCENLICTDGFEEYSPSSSKVGLVMELGNGAYWIHDGSQQNTPDICNASGNRYLNLVGTIDNPEGIAFKLSKSVPPGCILKINMDASFKYDTTYLNIHGSKEPPCSFLDTRISNDCVQRNCGDYIFSPVCIDTLNIMSAASPGGLCSSQPNLQPLTEIEWKNESGDSINYIIISPGILESDARSAHIDNVVITYHCIDPCFSFEYVEDCTEVEFAPCFYGEDLDHHWNFGDQNTSVISHPNHIYSTVDTFLVTHILSDGCGNMDSTSMSILVNGDEAECCPDTTLSVGTTWNLSTVLPGDGRFHTITLEQGVYLSIEDGLELEFCEGGAMIIETGAYLSLDGTLTSYGEMSWLGVFVEGDTSVGQFRDFSSGGFHGNQHGFIHTREGSMIKNAKIGIRNYGLDGDASTGGMIRCEGTSFINNTIAVDFGPYQNYNEEGQPLPSLGTFNNCNFNTDPTYHHHEPFHAFVKMRKADGMRFAGCSFTNELLPELPSEVSAFGFGIHAVSSGFKVFSIGSTAASPLCVSPCVVNDSTTFNGLGHGIYVMTQDKMRPYSVYQAQFENCFRGITSVGSTGGTMLFNTFKMGEVPDTDFSYGQIGVELHFNHEGFELQENIFERIAGGSNLNTIGILVNALGGNDNYIRRNTYRGIETANQAFGVNADLTPDIQRGLIYVCNTNDTTLSQGYDFHIPNTPALDVIHPFQTPGSLSGSEISAGNIFAYSAHDFMNFEQDSFFYFYNPLATNEEPRDSFLLGISKEQADQNSCVSSYCAPPCLEDIQDAKDDYLESNDDLIEATNEYTTGLATQNLSTIKSARSKVLFYQKAISKSVYHVVTHLMIDSASYNSDSLIAWLQKIDTYGGELLMASHYASKGDYGNAIGILESINTHRSISSNEDIDINYLIEIYSILNSKPPEALNPAERLTLRLIAYSNIGFSSGVARALLSYFSEYIPLPYYTGDQIAFRSSNDTSNFIFTPIPENQLIRVFPNPAKDRLFIEWDETNYNPVSIRIVNLYGQSVSNFEIFENGFASTELANYSTGIHFVVALDSTGRLTTHKVFLIH